MDGYIVGSMISANSITGEQIQANSIKTANLEVDVQEKITSATDEETVKTLIKADLDGFQVNVSNTYETKTNVETKVASTLNSAKSYADTKKNEAISSANNTLNTTIANYYTKSQTDSAINVAKDAINLGVSTNYETKANVETKVTSTLNSAKFYADTKKTEAINAASTDAANKANNAKNEAIASANNTLTTTIANYYTKEQTDSQINVAKDAINLGVSTNYETKANVETKVSSTLSSAKSYADAKKTEAISSANNTLNTTIANYYTKEQTDSAIKIAKDAINLGVSNTYETKTNVTTKINGVNNSISSLTTRMTNAESKITDTAITNVVKQNFYTKQETENQITSKGYQTESQVQQTANSLQIKFTESGGYNLFLNSGFKKNMDYWQTHTYNNPTDGSIGIITSTGDWGFPDASVNCVQIRLANQSGIEYGISQTIKTTIGKKYTLSFYYAAHRLNQANAIVRAPNGNWLVNKTITSFPSGGNSNVNNWSKHTLTFTANATSHTVNIVINSAGSNGHMWIAKPQVVEGELDLPYSPNPNEIYDGITTIDKDKIRIQHSNGSYSQMAVNGFKRFDSGTSRDYHYLSTNGVINVSHGTPVTVTLPSEFKGKDFKVTLSIFKVNIPSGVGWNGIYDIDSYTSNVDRSNAKFTVEAMVKSVNGQYGTVDISYVVIA